MENSQSFFSIEFFDSLYLKIKSLLEADGSTITLPEALAWELEDYQPESFAHYRCAFLRMLKPKHYLISGRIFLEKDLTYYSNSIMEFRVSVYSEKNQDWLDFEFSYDIEAEKFSQRIPERYEGKLD